MQMSYNEIIKKHSLSEVYIYSFLCNDAVSPYHNHDFFELVYVVKGSATHNLNGEIRTISEGDYMFMDYSTYHKYTALTDDFAVINCLFLSKAIDRTMPDCQNFMDLLKSYQFTLNKINMNINPVNRFFYDGTGSIKALLTEMCEECKRRQAGYRDYMKCLLIQIIIQTIRGISDETESAYSPLISKTITLIDEHFSEKLQLSSIASDMFISVPYLSSRFKAETGICFSDYLKQTRVHKACMMLNTTDYKIHTIAEKVGYSDYKRFGSVFREVTGTSPGKFRASVKKMS